MKNDNIHDVVKGLEEEIELVQMENYVNETEYCLKKKIKKCLVYIIPISISIIGMIIFPHPNTLLSGIILTSGVLTINHFLEPVESPNANQNNCYNNSYHDKEKENSDQILTKCMDENYMEEYYTELYQEVVKYEETEEERKYREAVERQNLKNFNIHLLDRKKCFLNKNETMKQIIDEIELYRVIYKLPPIIISNHQWDNFFDILYNLFLEKGVQYQFYESVAEIFRYTFARALVNKSDSININSFVENLYFLQKGYGDFNINLKEKEVLKIQKEILLSLETKKVLYLNRRK